jgi:hypothetical protein
MNFLNFSLNKYLVWSVMNYMSRWPTLSKLQMSLLMVNLNKLKIWKLVIPNEFKTSLKLMKNLIIIVDIVE